MEFGDEHYIRVYTRDTKTWKRWGWEGQVVFALTGRKLDALGRMSVDDPVADVALLTGLPEEVVRVGLARILESGTFVLLEGTLECPNWIDGQTGSKSDSARAREYRARLKARRDMAHGRRITNRDARVTENDGAVTECDVSITERPCSSRGVTPASNPAQPNPVQIRSGGPESVIQDLTGSALGEPGTRTLDVPKVDPPKQYLDAAVMAGVSTERASETWEYWKGRGLPQGGVRDLYGWLVGQAKKRSNGAHPDGSAVPAKGKFGRAPRQGDHGRSGFEKADIK